MVSQTPTEFVQDAFSIPYEPGSDITAGDVVVVGSTLVLVAKLNIATGQLGNLVHEGIFRGPKVTGVIAAFAKVYYDLDGDPLGGNAGAGAFTADPTKGPFAGWALAAAASDDEMVLFFLRSVPGLGVSGVGGGYKVARGSAVLDGSNPTPIATGLTTIVCAIACLNGTSAPGDNTSVLTTNYSGTDGTLDVYGWKNTAGNDPTLVASTGTEAFDWIAFGT